MSVTHSGYSDFIAAHKPPIDERRLALIVLDSIDRQVAKFDDPTEGAQVRQLLEDHLRAGHVRLLEPEGSDFLDVILGETWLARIHWQRICADPSLN